MADVALAFLWHQHQPYYPDDLAGQSAMPWVRLHGVKDYYGMALHLLEFPEMHCTINLVPSLLLQLQAYTERGATDDFLLASRRPADSLSEEDCIFLLDSFFFANAETMIRPNPRYAELYHRRGLGRNTAREALRRFQERDFRDLQVWFNLAWIHPLAFERDSELQALRDKGRYFTEVEKNWLLDKQLEILKQVIPLHRKLAESGQVELTTTPYYHPILPLLLDKKLAREAVPDIKLPRFTSSYAEDATVQVRRAVEQHAQIFGHRPQGMWPAEGSVCQEMLPFLAQLGIRWIATDEEILSQSTQGFVGRDSRGYVRNPERMYRPYKVGDAGSELSIVFRDHALSDMVGFHYQRGDSTAAAEDFVMRLRAIGEAVTSNEPALVPIILDGENCWEHYPGGGVAFLRALYQRCCQAQEIQPVSLGAYLQEHPPRDALPKLFPGSWINHNFAIWIGHAEDNTAWDALHRAREHLRQRAQQEQSAADGLRRAWEEIYIAEGSDWFWWYGEDHSSAQDLLFDYLFRKHLQNVYFILGDTPPAELSRPISRRGQRAVHSLPRAFLDVKIDGRQTFFEWISAGRYTCQNERGTMAMASRGPIKEVYFGFNLKCLLIRVDFDGPAKTALADFNRLRVGFVEPPGRELLIDLQQVEGRIQYQGKLIHRGPETKPAEIALAIDQIVEMAIPFEVLGVAVNQPIQFYVDVLEGEQSRDRAPREGTINLICPSPDFEQIMWNV
jgi:alpha-amylase/alpha-mannosidase (GH57 family)